MEPDLSTYDDLFIFDSPRVIQEIRKVPADPSAVPEFSVGMTYETAEGICQIAGFDKDGWPWAVCSEVRVMDLPLGYEIIQEPLRPLSLLGIIEEPIPLPDEESVTALDDGTHCTLIRVRKGTQDEVLCIALDQ